MDDPFWFRLFYNQFIAESINGLDFNICFCILQFFAKIFDLCINEVKVIHLIDVVSPYRFCQCVFIDQTAGTIYEIKQDIIFRRITLLIRAFNSAR